MLWNPPAFHMMAKPRGAVCNLDCRYCYYLEKAQLYPGSDFRMTPVLLEAYTRQYIAAQRAAEITFTWQGGEPLLLGRDFFRRALAYQARYRRPGMRITNAVQTNGTLIDDRWAAFFAEHGCLVGVSLDGPAPLHDVYRVDKGGAPTHARALAGLRRLQAHGAAFNVLASVHAANAEHALAVYRHLRDDVGAEFMQFIPIVVQDGAGGVTAESVTAAQYGDFLIAVFDEWVRRDVGRVFVQLFDVALAAWVGLPPGVCVFAETCGTALALEHNGDVYACDHFIDPAHRLGNITQAPLRALVNGDRQRDFGLAKRESLPGACRRCAVRFACNGGCPKNRFVVVPDDPHPLNYLCAGYKAFFTHIAAPMRFMADALRRGEPAATVMQRVW